MDKKYIGVQKGKASGKGFFRVSFFHEGVKHEFGYYDNEKEGAKAYDLYVLRRGYDRKTNFIKKKLSV